MRIIIYRISKSAYLCIVNQSINDTKERSLIEITKLFT